MELLDSRMDFKMQIALIYLGNKVLDAILRDDKDDICPQLLLGLPGGGREGGMKVANAQREVRKQELL